MIEINLIEKKKRNISSYLLIGITFFIVISVSISFLLYHGQLANQIDALTQTKAEQSLVLSHTREQTEVINQVEKLDQQTNQLQTALFPTIYLLNQVDAVLPEQNRIESFYFTLSDGLRVQVQAPSISDTSQYARAMSELNFIDHARLVNLEERSEQYIATFTFMIKRDSILEEAG